MELPPIVSNVLGFVSVHWKPLSLLLGLYLFLSFTELGRKIADAANAFADTYNDQYVEREEEEEDEGDGPAAKPSAKPAAANTGSGKGSSKKAQ